MKSVFEYSKYQAYLLDFFQAQRGNQARLAENLNCRPSFLTQVIDEKVDLSIEHALKIPDFLGLSHSEKLAFLMLVQKEKIQETSGKRFFEEQILKLKIQNKSIKERLNSLEELSDEAKSQYYSSWLYGAVHILCAFSKINTIDDLSAHLKLERPAIYNCVNFLLDHGLLEMKNRKLQIGKRQIHLSHDSKYIHLHHTNWRLKAIENFSIQKSKGTHFSSLVGISRQDAEQVQEILLKAVSEINALVQRSGEEAAYVINMDFFEL